MSNINNVREALKEIPSLDDILKSFDLKSIPLELFKDRLRQVLEKLRDNISNNNIPKNIKNYIVKKASYEFSKISKSSLGKVINGTGIILNTSLGRAPLSKSILDSVSESIYPYCNLEIDLETNTRGERLSHINPLINSLIGSEKSILVNNNAAAVMIMLNSLCKNKKVIISRGQQVEIGGSFRIPDIIKNSGCEMVEVVTTNKTHIKDYAEAIDEDTAAILYVHTSNYKVIGFTKEVGLIELSHLCKEYKIPLLCDLGSGAIYNNPNNFIPFEKEVQKYLDDGVDVVTYSGDKLLGGIQTGIISGKMNLIDKIHKNPIYRTLRCDKYRICLMENILRTYITTKNVNKKNISIMLFDRTTIQLHEHAKKIVTLVKEKFPEHYSINIEETQVEAGSGSLPTEKIPSVAISFESINTSADRISFKLRSGYIPILNYIKDDKVYIDLKAIPDDQIDELIDVIIKCL